MLSYNTLIFTGAKFAEKSFEYLIHVGIQKAGPQISLSASVSTEG